MANCNRQQLNITCGTDVVLHDRLIFDGETFDPNLSVGIAANLVSSLGKRTALDVQVVDDELLISVPWIDGTLPGCYGLEVTGSCNSKKWATYADSLIKYTKATRIGVSVVAVESDSYDITQEVGYCYSNSPVTFAEVTVDDGYGTPSVDVTYEQRVLSMAFHNLKGNGITDIEVEEQEGDEAVNIVTIKTDADQEGTEFQVRNGSRGNGIASSSESLSDQDGGINTFTITDDDGTVHEFHSKNGTKGSQGDSAVYDPSSPDTPDFVMANTTGDSTTKAMTQKAVTDEFDKFKEEPYDMASVTWVVGGITTAGYENNGGAIRLNRRSNEISFDVSTYDRVRVTAPNNKVRFAVYSIEGTGENRTFSIVSNGYINGPGEFYFTPESNKVYVIRVAGPNSTQAEIEALVASDYPVITLYNKSYTHIIDDVNERLGEIEEPLIEETIVPVYSYGGITTTSGVYYTVYTDKITPLISFDTSIVEKVVVHRRGTEVKFALYQISDTGVITLPSLSFVTQDYEFTPQEGYSYLIRFAPASGKSTKEVIDSIPKSSYPVFKVTYKTSSVKIKDAEDMMKAKNYTYRRNYANITGLLEFENKTISTSGITDNSSTLLAKIPNVGCVEVRMNTPLGGFSVWKKVGNTITCLKEYNHSQYRYTGDYTSEYYVLVQAESGNAGVNIVAVYTYSDEGVVSKYEAPSWAKGKKIAFLGDSIVQGRYPKNGSSVNIAMDKPWPNLVAEAFGTEDFMNFSIGGALIHDDSWRSIAAMAANVQDYDVVFVCGGTNDYGNKTSKTNFESTYSSMLATLIQNNAMVIPMTPVYRTRTVSSPVMPLSGYVQSIMQIAKDETIPAVPMYDLTNTSDFIAHLVDGLHPDETGQRIIAETILEWISKNIQ